jgi:exopolyphosphatase/guanosine-5'-triphosphate,3'-diphosphate pyrophosphatase
MPQIAVIDLGTNTFHLLVAEVTADGTEIVHKEKQSVKIGEDGISHGFIAPPAQERAIRTLQGFKEKIINLEVEQVHATATSAFRNASNGVLLAQDIFHHTGIKIEIIEGNREAQLIYQGVKQAVALDVSDSLIIDIGGGSVEFIICDPVEAKWIYSFEIGAQRLMDKFHHTDPINPEEIRQLEHYLDDTLSPLATALDQFQVTTLVGASGTFDTLSQIYMAQEGLAKPATPEQPLSIDGFQRIHQDIIQKNRVDRMKIPGMIEMRVDMIVVASSLINYLLRRFGLEQIRVSSYALKEGVLAEVQKSINS